MKFGEEQPKTHFILRGPLCHSFDQNKMLFLFIFD
jgi:hypothetical protein